MQSSGNIKLAELNQLLTCILCKGYFIDATTIVECLHSFCRTCIVRYLHTNKFCPSCEVQVHKTRPLLNIRSDQTLQDIVYKIVPGLFKNEMKRRRDFYQQQDASIQSSIPSSSEKRGDIWGCDRLIFTPEDIISVSLEYSPLNDHVPVNLQANIYPLKKKKLKQGYKRYFNCPGALKVYHLKKLLRAKYGLLNSKKKLDILYMHDLLKNQYTLVDLAYIYSWKRSEPLRLFFKITQEPTKLSKCNGTSLPSLPHSSLPSSPTAIPIATPVSSMASIPSSRHPSPPPSPQMAQEPNDIRIGKPNPAAIPETNGPALEKATKNEESVIIPEPSGFRQGKSTPNRLGAAKLHSATAKEPNGLKSIQSGQSAKYKSAVLGPNNLDTEGSVNVAKFANDAISEPNCRPLESLQNEKGSSHLSNGFGAEISLKLKHNLATNNDAIPKPNLCEKPEKVSRGGQSAAKQNSPNLEASGRGFDKSVCSGHATSKLLNSAKVHRNVVQEMNFSELEKSMRNGHNTNMPTAVVLLKKLDSSRFCKDHSDVISFPEFALKQTHKKSASVDGNNGKRSKGGVESDTTNASIPMPKLKSALKKTVSDDRISSPIAESKHSVNQQLLLDSELAQGVLSKRTISPGNGLRKRVSFSVNLVQDCNGRGLKRKLPDYFDDEAAFPVNGSAMGGLIHLRKKILSPKSS